MIITVATVVFNDVENLSRTIESVANQTYPFLEYIVIDGGSRDGTLDVIRGSAADISFFISEKDKGIYDAMNKAISVASGEWIIFMNSGDCFADEFVLERVAPLLCSSSDIVYGNHRVYYPRSGVICERRSGPVSHLWRGSQFCHQSAFVKVSYHKESLYSLQNRISADFEFFYHSYTSGRVFKKIDIVVSIVSSGGLSDKARVESILGWWKIVKKNALVNSYYRARIVFEIFKGGVKKVLPQSWLK